MKRILSFLLCLILVFGSFAAAFAIGFSDVPEGIYYFEPVYNIAYDNIISGFPDGSFRPGASITRAQMAVMLVNMKGISPYMAEEPRFPDVDKTHWAYKYVEAAAREGFIAGYTDGNFRPDKDVSYDEAITMIVALMGYTLQDLGGSYPEAFTSKARDLGILNTCAMLGKDAATRANVSCFLRDAIIASREDYDAFKYVGPGYKITLGPAKPCEFTQGESKTEWYAISLFVENTSSEPLPVNASKFGTFVNGVQAVTDSAGYAAFPEYKIPSGSIPAGGTARIDLMYPSSPQMTTIDIHPDLAEPEEEPLIELLF